MFTRAKRHWKIHHGNFILFSSWREKNISANKYYEYINAYSVVRKKSFITSILSSKYNTFVT